MKVKIKIKDLETGHISNSIPIDELIYNQNEIEFNFRDGSSLPYKDFLFFQNDYEVIVKVVE